MDTNYAPPSAPPGATTKYVQVRITAPKEAFFIQIVYNQPLNVTTESVGRCNPASSSSSTFIVN